LVKTYTTYLIAVKKPVIVIEYAERCGKIVVAGRLVDLISLQL